MYWENDYDQRIQFCRDGKPTAIKEHKCYECGRTIKIGEKYLYFVGAWYRDGFGKFFRAYKICSNCKKDWDEIIDVFYNNGKYEACIIYGLLNEAIQDAFDEGFLKEDDWLARYLNGNNEKKEACRIVAQMKACSTPLL